ncbi:MAG: formylglycine-generating enzyme family protein [Cyanobacteria bacterium J06626_18]
MANTSQKRYTSTAPRLSITRHKTVVQHFIEKLSDGIGLDMVLIQGGTFLAGMSLLDENAPNGMFLMGSPENELERYNDEGPQHEVTVPTFFMGQFPITQAQWRIVAATYPQAQRSLDPNPAHFKGDNRPVERVSWYDAVEFCTRLSRKTGRTYCLPSEAEWEYACRAGTTSPFHFGETITTGLANYNGSKYGRGPEGENREETTDVGSLDNPNAFGLYDMHGNVWEWCLDHWHDNYEENPPTDGSAWLFSEESKEHLRVLRGGSWVNDPGDCRSACRDYNLPVERGLNYGFRVVCSAARLSS